MSPALLSKRLTTLVQAGVVERHQDSAHVSYRLTPAGRELVPIVQSIGRWGIRWIPELGDVDLDPHVLMWDMHRGIDHDEVPTGRTTVEFVFDDVPPSVRRWWLVINESDVHVCDADPGYDVRITVNTTLRTMSRVWRGDIPLSHAQRAGQLTLIGDSTARRAFPRWLKLSTLAGTPRSILAAVS